MYGQYGPGKSGRRTLAGYREEAGVAPRSRTETFVALRLTIDDLDLDKGVVLITGAKDGRQRIVLLDPTSCRAITAYLHRPDRRRAGLAPEHPVLTTGKGTKVPESNARGAFHAMTQHADLAVRMPIHG